MKRTIEIDSYWDDSGDVFYVLPSGFPDTWIIVNESPIDFDIRHIDAAEREAFVKEMENRNEDAIHL